jgi:hypothetical protein
MQAAVMIYIGTVAYIFKRAVGRGRKRHEIMLAGTLGGFALGVLVATPVSQWLKIETSVICVCLGLTIGWTVAWLFARRIPREA